MTPHLPVLTSAAVTAFCSAKLDGPGGVSLWLDGNQKIMRNNGTYETPKPNAFSLVQIEDCPHSTPTCRAGCYVHGLEANAPDTHALYRHNSLAIRRILGDFDKATAVAWSHELADWITTNAGGGFRWHVSGDIFSRPYAAWIHDVVMRSPKVEHWIYTRSFPFIGQLVGMKNLALNLSCDQDNFAEALKAYVNHGDKVRLCYYTRDGFVPDLPRGSVIFPDYGLRGARGETPAEQRASSPWWQGLDGEQRAMTCPVDFYGKQEDLRCGPCSRCL